MNKPVKTVVYDESLRLEAYRFEGAVQPFPNHFHEYFVVGLMEGGQRRMSCKNRTYLLEQDDIVLFNPGDNHACAPVAGSELHYRGINITQKVMLDLAEEVTGQRQLPGFSRTVVRDEELACYQRALHEMIMTGSNEFEKEEALLLMTARLIGQYSRPFACCLPACRKEIADACALMQAQYAEHLSLDQLCGCAGLSKSTLLRAFTREKGMTPYRYLQTVRVNEAKKLLEQGVPLLETAMRTGFADQSHFTRFFSQFIGLAPGAYRDIFVHREAGGDVHGA